MKMFKKAFTVFLVAILLVISVPITGQNTAKAESLEELTEQRKDLQEQLKEINDKLAEIKDEAEKVKAKADTYNERKGIVEGQISLLNASISLKNDELTIMQEELDLKVQQRAITYELYKQMIRSKYMTNSSSELAVLLGASSFSEFLVTAEMLRRVSEHDTGIIEQLEKEEEEIAEAKSVIEAELKLLEIDKEELDSKYGELALLLQEANAELSAAEAEQEATEEYYKKVREEFDRVDREWNALMGTGESGDLGTGVYAWPVPGFSWISSGFGDRFIFGQIRFHGGIDIAGSGINGKPVVAADTGKVAVVGYNSSYGNYIMIDHGGNNWTVYAHLSGFNCSRNQMVSRGQTIGYVGSTGNSTGPHLHFEVRINGVRVNPLGYVSYS